MQSLPHGAVLCRTPLEASCISELSGALALTSSPCACYMKATHTCVRSSSPTHAQPLSVDVTACRKVFIARVCRHPHPLLTAFGLCVCASGARRRVILRTPSACCKHCAHSRVQGALAFSFGAVIPSVSCWQLGNGSACRHLDMACSHIQHMRSALQWMQLHLVHLCQHPETSLPAGGMCELESCAHGRVILNTTSACCRHCACSRAQGALASSIEAVMPSPSGRQLCKWVSMPPPGYSTPSQ